MTPRSYLFVPGDRPERFDKALASGADRVVFDLEDAVAPADKPAARQAVAQWLAAQPEAQRARVLVRLNDALSPAFADDLCWLASQPLLEVMLAKAEAPAQVATVRACLPASAQVLALVETARGVQAAAALAATPGVSRLALGAIDYALDLDLPAPRGPAVEAAAVALALASRAAELPPPVAGVTVELEAERVRADLLHERQLGFGAKLCIHPRQVAAIHDALRPDADALAWAERVCQAWASAGQAAAFQLDGRMVDKPVLLRARRLLERAA